MARRGVRQSEIAEALKITQQAVSQKLSGRRPFTDLEVSVVARCLGVSPGSLFAETATAMGGAA